MIFSGLQQQVMSTPIVNIAPKKFWVNNLISPITSNENLSDSDRSSNEEYKSVRSSLSKCSLENYSQRSADSIPHLGGSTTKLKSAPNPLYYATQKMYKSNSSHNNMKTLQLKSENTLSMVHKSKNKMEVPPPATNLKQMDQKLKASYTSLRPISTNLPVAPPITSMNVTKTLIKSKNTGDIQNLDYTTKVVEVSFKCI